MKSPTLSGVNGPSSVAAAGSPRARWDFATRRITKAGARPWRFSPAKSKKHTLSSRALLSDIRRVWKSFRDSIHLPATIARHAHIVEEGFWAKLRKLAGHIPFVEDLAAAYFCVVDPATPGRVRGVILAALAWFVLPTAVMPEFVAVLGFTNEIAVTAIAVRMIRKHLKERHYVRARAALSIPEPLVDT